MAVFRETLRAWLTRLEGTLDDFEASAAAFTASQFVGLSGTNSTTSTSFVDLTDLTLTVSVEDGDVLLVHAYMSTINTTASQGVHARLMVDGVAVQGADMPQGGGSCAMLWRAAGLAAGSHTIKIQWKVPGGTATCNAGSAQQGGGILVERVRA